MVVVIFCTNVFGQVSAFEQKATSVTLSTSFVGVGWRRRGRSGSHQDQMDLMQRELVILDLLETALPTWGKC
jgi:hypothetical protein